MTTQKPQHHPRWLKLAAGAAIILLVGGIFMWEAYWLTPRTTKEVTPVMVPSVPPGTDKAILTLTDGRRLSLDTTIHDSVFTDGNSIIVIHDGSLLYNPGSKQADSASYNTLTTPRGGQWRLTLPDSTQVWLDASSSITYSTNKLPKVTLRGQAYFEVHKTPGHPFIVAINDTAHSISSPHFNVNAYQDEPRTTITRSDDPIADTAAAFDWKNGYLVFQNAPIQQAMRTISRWYDVDIHYQGVHETLPIDATLRRDLDLEQAISALEFVNGAQDRFHHHFENQTLVITP